MPKLKQPTSLQTMALDVLVEWIVRGCDRLSVNASLGELRHGIAVIKENVCKSIPWLLLDNFCTRILHDFFSTTRPTSHHRAMLEIIMDAEIVGLSMRHAGRILGCLDLRDADRLRRLEILNLGYFSDFNPTALRNFHLNELKKLIFENACTDSYLEIIGRNCPKLEVLKIRYSPVTDEGLLAVSPCSELRVVDVVYCYGVSRTGINQLLSAHKKLEKLHYGDESYVPSGGDYDVLSVLDSSVQCPSANYFLINSQYVTDANLRSIVTKFPNLSYIAINGSATSHLATLKHLDKLTGIELSLGIHEPGSINAATWKSLKELLTFIGGRMKILKLYWYDETLFFGQNELNFVFDFCPNIEYFTFDHSPDEPLLVIPPFRELKQLMPRPRGESHALEFGTMSNLETLSLCDYKLSPLIIESMLLDHVKFPNLSAIEINEKWADHIDRVARCNNLDIKVIKCMW